MTFVDRGGVSRTISGVEGTSGGASGGVQGEGGLGVDACSRNVEDFEHILGHVLAVGGWPWG